jgi:thiamine biosynthesis lipoprotein
VSLTSVVRGRLGEASLTFDCCDTEFTVQARGVRARTAAERARRTALDLEAQLDAFDTESAVSRLYREGRVTNEHVAAVVRRGLAYHDRTNGAFGIVDGALERDLKAYIRGETNAVTAAFASEDADESRVTVDGDRVTTDCRLDLNGLAKGYVVDRATSALSGVGREGFVGGGGDLSPPTGPVAVESPYGDDRPLRVLDTDWAVATSGGYRRERDGVDHVYDPQSGRVGARNESVTVVARRDCTEADALATTLSALPPDEALALAEEWNGVEALVVHDGSLRETAGFTAHLAADDRSLRRRTGDRWSDGRRTGVA